MITSVSSWASVIPNAAHIYVEGYAEKDITPDQIKISVSIIATNLDAEVAKLAIDQRSLKLFETTKQLGLTADQITATSIQIVPAVGYENGKRIDQGTRVSRNIDILLKDLTQYPQLNDVLISAKITSKISSTVQLSDERGVNKKLLMLAMTDAKLKAEELADIQGKKIKDIYSISEFKTRPENAYNLRPNQSIYGGAHLDYETRHRVATPMSVFKIGKMKATATVYVVYTIE